MSQVFRVLAVVAAVGIAFAVYVAVVLRPAAHPTPPPTGSPRPFSHVFVIVMENLGYAAALTTPAIAALAQKWAYASNCYATAS